MKNKPIRKLAAIMFTDLAGFTESMSSDEAAAIGAVKKKRVIIQPLIKKYNGVFVKEIGDGTLSYFGSAVDASNCAIHLQESTYDEKHLNIRVGLHIGDIVFDGDDVFGEGVNIASRLESLSPIGGVCVSKNIYDELENKKEFNGTSLGLQSLKGVGRLLEVYTLKGDKLKDPDIKEFEETQVQKHTDNEVPSIAIIPFDNKGADEDIFYAYGISSDLISDVASAGLIRVASLKEIEELGDLPFKEKARKLSVRYVSNGTLWKMGEIFQLSIELYDIKDSKVVWSDRWQENWDNLPLIKSNLSDGLLKALDTKPKPLKRLETIDTKAYELYLKAKHRYDKRDSKEDTRLARGLLQKAIKIDDSLITAKNLLGTTYRQMDENEKALEIYSAALDQAEMLDDKPSIGDCLSNIGTVSLNKSEYEKSLDYYNRALKIREELGDKWGIGVSLRDVSLCYLTKYDYDRCLDFSKRSLAIAEELDDKIVIGSNLGIIGFLYFSIGEKEIAIDYLEKALKINQKIDYKFNIGNWLWFMAYLYYDQEQDMDKALEYIQRGLIIIKEIGLKENELPAYVTQGIIYKHLGKDFDCDKIYEMISEREHVSFEFYTLLYEFFKEKTYLLSAYKQIQEIADTMEEQLKVKFFDSTFVKRVMDEYAKLEG